MKNLILVVVFLAPNVAFCMNHSNSTLYKVVVDDKDPNEITLKKVKRSKDKTECDSYQLACRNSFPLPVKELHGTMSSGHAGHLYTFKSTTGDKRGKYIAIIDQNWDLYSVFRRLNDDELKKFLNECVLTISSIKDLKKRGGFRKDNIKRLNLDEYIRTPIESEASTLDVDSDSNSSWSLLDKIDAKEGQDEAVVEEVIAPVRSGSSWFEWLSMFKR